MRKKEKRVVISTPKQEREAIRKFYETNDVIHVDCKIPYGTTDTMRTISG